MEINLHQLEALHIPYTVVGEAATRAASPLEEKMLLDTNGFIMTAMEAVLRPLHISVSILTIKYEGPGPSHPYSFERRADSLPLPERNFQKGESIRDTDEIRHLHLLVQAALHIRSSHLGKDQADLHTYRLVQPC